MLTASTSLLLIQTICWSMIHLCGEDAVAKKKATVGMLTTTMLMMMKDERQKQQQQLNGLYSQIENHCAAILCCVW